jgi:N-methylhydantoinase A/oxoprolinase/acetone carboxylase beta subunit
MTHGPLAARAELNSVDIDVGGTFTDAVLTPGGRRWIGKAPTTPYDLSVCFVNAIEEVADQAGEDLESLLPRLDVIRYSTTVAMNRLIERRGPRVGLITTEGHEDAILIGRGAYLQRLMQNELSAMWDQLRARGYQGSFLMIHNSGGSGEVFKTTASRTYNGGPVSGLMGSYHLATSLGYKNVVAGDMGGTSFDIGLVVDASVRNYESRPIIDRWMVGITMLQTLSIGAGGGSIAWIDHNLGG